MEQKQCTGDCLRCSFQQQVYCASQHGHAILRELPQIKAQLDRLEASLARFAPAGDFINPLETTQKGAGVDE